MCDGQVVDVTAVQEHVAVVAKRGEKAGERHGGSYITPDVSAGVEVCAAFVKVGGVAVEFEPEVFDLRVAECLEDAPVEFVPGGIRCTRFVKLVRYSAIDESSRELTKGM